ncbi:ORF2 [torque teno Delphinidae virus 53]
MKILTGAEQTWITTIYTTHGLFCDCAEPVEHMIRCLHTHIAGDDGFEDALLTFAMEEPFDDDTGDGAAAGSDHATGG